MDNLVGSLIRLRNHRKFLIFDFRFRISDGCEYRRRCKMKKKTTITDIAIKLGITPSSVSKAFNNHPRISPETKKAVIEMGEALGYKPNYMATGLRKGKSGLVGLLVPGIHYSFF